MTTDIPEATDFSFTFDSVRNPALGGKSYDIQIESIATEKKATIDSGIYTIATNKITKGDIVEFTV